MLSPGSKAQKRPPGRGAHATIPCGRESPSLGPGSVGEGGEREGEGGEESAGPKFDFGIERVVFFCLFFGGGLTTAQGRLK